LGEPISFITLIKNFKLKRPPTQLAASSDNWDGKSQGGEGGTLSFFPLKENGWKGGERKGRDSIQQGGSLFVIRAVVPQQEGELGRGE